MNKKFLPLLIVVNILLTSPTLLANNPPSPKLPKKINNPKEIVENILNTPTPKNWTPSKINKKASNLFGGLIIYLDTIVIGLIFSLIFNIKFLTLS